MKKKKKIGSISKKYVETIGRYENFNQLNNFIHSKEFSNNKFFVKKKFNLKKILFIQYHRNYFQLPNDKLRVTVDEKLRIFYKYPNKFIDLDQIIIELKYDTKDSYFVNSFIKLNNLNNRNQKFSKYVNSFIQMNECALI